MSAPSSLPRVRRGFSMTELLVAIAIIAVLISLLLPAVMAAREAMRRATCANHVRQISLALLQYHDNKKVFPPGEIHKVTEASGVDSVNRFGPHCYWDGSIGCWMSMILPHIEESIYFDMVDNNAEPQWGVPTNQEVMKNKYPTFLCPSDPYHDLTSVWRVPENRARILHYYAVAGSDENSQLPHPDGTLTYGHCNANDGMFFNDSSTSMAKIVDGASNTAMICEVWGRTMANSASDSRGMNLHAVVYFDWTPNSARFNPWHANSFHVGGVNCSFADGSVHYITDQIDLPIFKAISTIKGKEVIDGARIDL
jgi:prepilin-type N-terminal cleavage/methylation domain-containing protein/prepilin-type processing-associated H-X9-DG protein